MAIDAHLLGLGEGIHWGITAPAHARTAGAERRQTAADVLCLLIRRRVAILLIGGDKTGDKRFYERMIPIADRLYDAHLAELKKEKNMAGRHSFAELRARMTPQTRAKAEAQALRLDAEMNLAEVRRASKLSQEEIAHTLQIGQGSVAKIEKRADMYVSTLRRFIEAMGGELEIVARFAGHSVTIKNFSDLSEREPV
jgi:DNA-binding transcriptional regulator YiaG